MSSSRPHLYIGNAIKMPYKDSQHATDCRIDAIYRVAQYHAQSSTLRIFLMFMNLTKRVVDIKDTDLVSYVDEYAEMPIVAEEQGLYCDWGE